MSTVKFRKVQELFTNRKVRAVRTDQLWFRLDQVFIIKPFSRLPALLFGLAFSSPAFSSSAISSLAFSAPPLDGLCTECGVSELVRSIVSLVTHRYSTL